MLKQVGLKNISLQKKFPLVSAIIPTYNRAGYLKEAIESVLRQSYPEIELIVVDDGSTDGTREILRAQRIKYFYQQNLERGAARNQGILSSRGEYVAFLDSDDLWLPNHIEICVSALERESGYGVAFSNAWLIDSDGKTIGKNPKATWKGNLLEKMVRNYSSGGCNSSSCLIRKWVFDPQNMFNIDSRLSGSEDWEMWVRLSHRAHFLSTDDYTVKLRVHPEQSSQRVEKMEKSMTLALDLVFQNRELFPKIERWKRQGYGSLYAVIATNYYGTGDFGRARHFLKRAILEYPLSLWTNKRISNTFLKMLLGKKMITFLRSLRARLFYDYLKKNGYQGCHL